MLPTELCNDHCHMSHSHSVGCESHCLCTAMHHHCQESVCDVYIEGFAKHLVSLADMFDLKAILVVHERILCLDTEHLLWSVCSPCMINRSLPSTSYDLQFHF